MNKRKRNRCNKILCKKRKRKKRQCKKGVYVSNLCIQHYHLNIKEVKCFYCDNLTNHYSGLCNGHSFNKFNHRIKYNEEIRDKKFDIYAIRDTIIKQIDKCNANFLKYLLCFLNKKMLNKDLNYFKNNYKQIKQNNKKFKEIIKIQQNNSLINTKQIQFLKTVYRNVIDDDHIYIVHIYIDIIDYCDNIDILEIIFSNVTNFLQNYQKNLFISSDLFLLDCQNNNITVSLTNHYDNFERLLREPNEYYDNKKTNLINKYIYCRILSEIKNKLKYEIVDDIWGIVEEFIY